MEITIKTKYDIDDTVYASGFYHGFYPIRKSYIIKNILLNGSINNLKINYEVEQDEFVEYMPESWLFPTYAECTKWCKKQNKIS